MKYLAILLLVMSGCAFTENVGRYNANQPGARSLLRAPCPVCNGKGKMYSGSIAISACEYCDGTGIGHQ